VSRIALIQNYPYDAVAGGDGAFIQSFGRYLSQLGHEIHGLVTDTTRGRTSPIYRSFYPVDKYRSWSVRHAVRISRRAFVDYRLSRFPVKLLEKMGWRPPTKEAREVDWARPEALWCVKQLEKLRPEAIILCFEAVHFAPLLLTSFHGRILSIPGPIPGRRLKNVSADQNKISPVQAELASALAYADCVGLNSHDDLSYAVKRLNVKRALVVGMGFPSQAILPESSEPIILFVGNATAPNRDGLRWFLENVWPAVRAACPEARFRIVGRAALNSPTGPEVAVDRVGPVADLTPEYQRAQVVIAPLVSGTAGVKIKVAEAMSYGRPLVSTFIGVDGGDPGQLDPAAIVADDPTDFAQGIIALLRDPHLRRQKSAGAAEVFESCFSYNSSYGALSNWIDQIIPEVLSPSEPPTATEPGRSR
jgi:glycosyltransferase involved in cell wall biosynthesis